MIFTNAARGGALNALKEVFALYKCFSYVQPCVYYSVLIVCFTDVSNQLVICLVQEAGGDCQKDGEAGKDLFSNCKTDSLALLCRLL